MTYPAMVVQYLLSGGFPVEAKRGRGYSSGMADMVRETADTVYATFRSLKKTEREAVIERLLRDRQFREDLLDIAIIEQRRGGPGRPLREYLASREASSR
jgi:hypothetical protein